MAKTKNRFTPAAPAVYCFLSKPKTKFKAEGEYSATIILDENDPFVAEIREECDAAFREATKGLKPADKKDYNLVYPFGEVKDEKGNPTGQVSMRFKSNAQYKDKKTGEIKQIAPRVYDAMNTRLEVVPNVGNGSVIKIAFATKAYQMKQEDKRNKTSWYDCGLSLYLNAVQIRELVEYGGGNDGFDTDESGYKAQTKPAGDFDGADGEGVGDTSEF